LTFINPASSAGFFAGAGAMYAFFNNFVSPSTVSLAQSVEALLMAIVGGIGTLFGAFVGAATIIVLENAVSAYTERWPTALGIAFIVVMIFAPEGIVGTIRRFSGATRVVELNKLEGTDHGPKAIS
jgi:branched-chain amino acid transport system permease protein